MNDLKTNSIKQLTFNECSNVCGASCRCYCAQHNMAGLISNVYEFTPASNGADCQTHVRKLV